MNYESVVAQMHKAIPYCSKAILNRVYRLSRFKVGDLVRRVVKTNDPSIDDLGHVGEVTAIYFGDTNVLRVRWRAPNIARWISRAYMDGKYSIEECVDPFHVSPLYETRGLSDTAPP